MTVAILIVLAALAAHLAGYLLGTDRGWRAGYAEAESLWAARVALARIDGEATGRAAGRAAGQALQDRAVWKTRATLEPEIEAARIDGRVEALRADLAAQDRIGLVEEMAEGCAVAPCEPPPVWRAPEGRLLLYPLPAAERAARALAPLHPRSYDRDDDGGDAA